MLHALDTVATLCTPTPRRFTNTGVAAHHATSSIQGVYIPGACRKQHVGWHLLCDVGQVVWGAAVCRARPRTCQEPKGREKEKVEGGMWVGTGGVGWGGTMHDVCTSQGCVGVPA